MPSWGLRSPCTKGWKELYWTKRRQCLWRSSWACSQCSRLVHVVLCRSNVQHVVAADQNLGDNEVIRYESHPIPWKSQKLLFFRLFQVIWVVSCLPLPGCQCRSRRCTPRCWQAASSCTRRMRPRSPMEGCLGIVRTNKKTLWKENTRAFQHVSYLVLMAPLQLDHDCLASESIEEGLGVHGHRSHPEFGLALWNWSSSGQ